MKAGGGGPTVIFRNVDLTPFYLFAARRAAAAALAFPRTQDSIDDRLEHGILTILWATLALESGANSNAEIKIPRDSLDDFIWSRGVYRKPRNRPQIIWKWQKLFSDGLKVSVPATDSIWTAAEELIRTRNSLAHYRLEENAARFHFDPKPPILFSPDMQPTKVEPSLVESLLESDKPKWHFNAARAIFHRWEIEAHKDVPHFEKAVPPL
jgi:hypothetical protein